ncbi:hypothetical protein AAA799P11_01498, partial [Marine Group I thaumarchaeote SCGC AAA799-P11]
MYPERTDETNPDVKESFFELLLKTDFAILEPPKIAQA